MFAMHDENNQLGFPAELTSGFDPVRGYAWKRLTLEGVVTATPGLQEVGEYALTADDDTSLTSGTRGWLEPAPGRLGYIFIPASSSGSVSPWKSPVRAATTTAGALATAFADGQTVDGVTLATGDRVLVKNQASPAENGVYVVASSGAPARATDADSASELLAACVAVTEGTANKDTVWLCTANATITVGTTALPWELVGPRGFPVELTSVWNASTGYDWKRLVQSDVALSDASPSVTGQYAMTADGNTGLASGTRGWLELGSAAGGRGWIFVVDTTGATAVSAWKSPAVRCATTTALPSCSYSNGSSGVGATLTGTSNGALASQDGITLTVGQALLVKDQSSQAHNGIYDLTTVGSGGAPFVLTRRTDADSASDLLAATVAVTEGTVNADRVYLCTANATIAVGTTALPWVRFVPSPLSTKGDLWAFSTVDTRLGVGTDTKVLVADSGQTEGLAWGYRVQGPSSATDNAIARFDGTSGRVIQNSAVLVDDIGNVTTEESFISQYGGGYPVGYLSQVNRGGMANFSVFGSSPVKCGFASLYSADGSGIIPGPYLELKYCPDAATPVTFDHKLVVYTGASGTEVQAWTGAGAGTGSINLSLNTLSVNGSAGQSGTLGAGAAATNGIITNLGSGTVATTGDITTALAGYVATSDIGVTVQAYSAVLDALAAGTDVAVADGGTGASDAATARTNLGVAIGSDVQAYSARLDTLAAGTSSAVTDLVDATTGTPGGTVTDVGAAFSQSAINDALASLLAKVNEIAGALRTAGVIT